jgi:fructose-1,6-bisphosphatase/inositol monophosphatase family enzyme
MVDYLHAKGTQYDSTSSLGIETKTGQSDFCTNIDIQNEKLISDRIQQIYPNHDIIGEESVGTGSIPPLQVGVPTWIIDPIDGTTNFFAGLHALTCVSIGYCDGVTGRPVVGVIYAPGTDELYVAVSGYGAYRNGERIYQRREQSTKSLQDAVVCVEFGYTRNKEHIDIVLGSVSKVMESGCRAIRQLGSGCMDLCYVASGRIDVVYAGVATEGWKPWDYAAGLVVCQEAGCIMESLEQEQVGTDFDLYSTSIICGVSRELVDELRLILFFH